jgi:activator of HSP90 ATPase
MVRAYTQSSNITYEAHKGGRFSLFDGNITGSFVELVSNTKIVMNWRYKQWPEEHFSQATLEIKEKEDCTELTLNQTGIPSSFLDNTQEGWRRFYWSAIRQTFGFGAQLM